MGTHCSGCGTLKVTHDQIIVCPVCHPLKVAKGKRKHALMVRSVAQRRRRQERREFGLCPICAAVPSPGFVLCDIHRQKSSQVQALVRSVKVAM